MKKIIASVLALVLLLSFTACGTASVPTDAAVSAAGETSAAETAGQGIEVNNGLILDTVTMPESYFGDMTEEEIKAAAKEKGFVSCTINEDGSVTYTMTKEQHAEMLSALTETIDAGLGELVSGENAFGSYRGIEHNENCTEFSIYVDYEEYENSWDAFGVLAVYVYGSYYQACAGVSSDDIDFTVYLKDDATGEIMGTSHYREWLNQYNETDTDIAEED